MEFPRIDSALETCRRHLASLGEVEASVAVELESHLVAAMTLLIVSEYETFIEDAFGKRGDRCGDLHVANYVRSQLTQRFRSPDLGKVNKILGCFGEDYLQSFFKDIENTREHAAWDNIMRARHAIVHRQGVINLTFRELRDSYDRTKVVMERLVRALEL
jgi:hypothetical protein